MTEKFTAIVGQDQDEDGRRSVGMTVRRAVWAGVDGPLFSREIAQTEDPDEISWIDLGKVDEILKAEGFERAEGWKIYQTYAGMSLEAELVKL